MFFVISLTKTLVINPKFLGPKLEQVLKKKLKDAVEGTVSGRYGFIIYVLTVESYGDGLIKDGTGDVLFNVKYQAVVFRPFKGEVLDGVVSDVKPDMIHLSVGPLEAAIGKGSIPAEWTFDPISKAWVNEGKKIMENSDLRFRVLGISTATNKFFVVGVINDECLGVI